MKLYDLSYLQSLRTLLITKPLAVMLDDHSAIMTNAIKSNK
jgi:hypothetical protein